MKSLIRSIAAATVATTALASTPALAHDRDHDRREPCDRGGPVAVYYPAPPPPAVYAPVRWEHRELRREYRELEEAREQFYSSWHNRGQTRKFERWYAFRKAELDRRWYAVASR